VQRDLFDLGEESRRLTAERKDIGAVVAFTGWCRDEGKTLTALELEHYALRRMLRLDGRSSASPSFTAAAGFCRASRLCWSSPPPRTGSRPSRRHPFSWIS
jgi:hypothetical protein